MNFIFLVELTHHPSANEPRKKMTVVRATFKVIIVQLLEKKVEAAAPGEKP